VFQTNTATALATGNNEWAAAFQKAEALVKQMTLEEKVRNQNGRGTHLLTHGIGEPDGWYETQQ